MTQTVYEFATCQMTAVMHQIQLKWITLPELSHTYDVRSGTRLSAWILCLWFPDLFVFFSQSLSSKASLKRFQWRSVDWQRRRYGFTRHPLILVSISGIQIEGCLIQNKIFSTSTSEALSVCVSTCVSADCRRVYAACLHLCAWW